MRRSNRLGEKMKRGSVMMWLLPLVLSGETLVVDLEDVTLDSPPMVTYEGPGGGSYYNGSDEAGGFNSRGTLFENLYIVDWASWSGWAYSTTADTETPGFMNQYSAYPGVANDGSVYAVTYAPSKLDLPTGWKAPLSVSLTNVSYAALSMLHGDDFSKKFGDDSSSLDVVETDYPDYFKVILTGIDPHGMELGRVEVYLADYRGESNSDYVLADWLEVDLSGLGTGVSSISIALESTDVGAWGMNTPSYLAVDTLVLGSSATWAGYDQYADGWVESGDFLGWVYPAGDYSYVDLIGNWVYLPETDASARDGSWIYIPKK